MPCFIDTMRPVTPAETAAWRFYLNLNSNQWRAARVMFRRTCQGENHGAALLRFVAESGLNDTAVIVRLEILLRDLALERLLEGGAHESAPKGLSLRSACWDF